MTTLLHYAGIITMDAGGRIRAWFAPCTILTASDERIVHTKDLADRLSTGVTMPVAETKAEAEVPSRSTGCPPGKMPGLPAILEQ